MSLCTRFQRLSARIHYLTRNLSNRHYHLISIPSHWDTCTKPIISVSNQLYSIAFFNASYGSVWLLSSLSLVRFSCAALIIASLITATNSTLSGHQSLFIKCYKIHLFCQAIGITSLIVSAISRGLNVKYITDLLLSKIFYVITHSLIYGIGCVSLILNGRIKGYMNSRSMSNVMGQVQAICVGSISQCVLDITIHSCVTSLGTVGIKVAIIH